MNEIIDKFKNGQCHLADDLRAVGQPADAGAEQPSAIAALGNFQFADEYPDDQKRPQDAA